MTTALTITPAIPLSDVERMAIAIAKSQLFGVKTPDQALALMLISQAEGLHPALAARDYHVIQGRPTLKADAMMARFQAAGGSVKWGTYTEQTVSAAFSHPQGGSVTVEWTIDMAKRAGLTKNPTWTQYPRQMLRARVISEGIRTVFPGAVVGVYTPEEVQDMPQERDITPEREQPAGKVAALRAALRPAQTEPPAPPAPPPTLPLSIVLEWIAEAQDTDTLAEIYDRLGEIADKDERKQAVHAGKKRSAELRAASPAPDPDQTEGTTGDLIPD